MAIKCKKIIHFKHANDNQTWEKTKETIVSNWESRK